MGHRWGISGDLSIEQVPGGGYLANFGFVLFLVDKLGSFSRGFDQLSCPNRWGVLPFLQVISVNAPPFPGMGGGGGFTMTSA